MKYYVLFFFVLFLCACTGDENSSSCFVSVQLLSPTDEVTLPFEEMEVVLTIRIKVRFIPLHVLLME